MSDLIKFPLDLTGESATNYVPREQHTLTTRLNRIFVPDNGLFYTKDLVVYDRETDRELVRDIDYVAAQLMEKLTVRTGKEVCAYVVVTNPAVSNNVDVTYRPVGGYYSLSVDALNELIETLQLDDRPVSWGELLGTPNLFPPGHHFHDIGDIYGFEYVVYAIEKLREAILVGDQALWDDLDNKIRALRVQLMAADDAINLMVSQHTSNMANPHQTTAEQINAYTKPQVDQLLATLQNTLNQSLTSAIATVTNDYKAADMVLSNKIDAVQQSVRDELIPRINQVSTDLANGLTAVRSEFAAADNAVKTYAAQLVAALKAEVDPKINQLTTNLNAGLADVRSEFAAADAALGVRIDTLTNTINNTVIPKANGALAVANAVRADFNVHSHYRLVNGDKQAVLYGDGNLVSDGDVWGYSDKRLKEDIRLVSDPLTKIDQLNGVLFKYKASGKISGGVIAQQLQVVLPELVETTETGYLAVKYNALSCLFVESIKAHSVQIRDLETRLANQQEQIHLLIEQVKRLTQD